MYYSLLLNGCVSLMQEKYEDAETFFEAATCEDEKSVLAWTTLGGCIDMSNLLVIHRLPSFMEPVETCNFSIFK